MQLLIGGAEVNFVTVKINTAHPFLCKTGSDQLNVCVLVWIFLNKFLFGNTKCRDYRDPENNSGVWVGSRLKQQNTRNTTKQGRKR